MNEFPAAAPVMGTLPWLTGCLVIHASLVKSIAQSQDQNVLPWIPSSVLCVNGVNVYFSRLFTQKIYFFRPAMQEKHPPRQPKPRHEKMKNEGAPLIDTSRMG